MTEVEAHDWIIARFGPEAHANLMLLENLVRVGASEQNLIAPSTLPTIWIRHIVDSAQLLLHAETGAPHGAWLDIGTGAGFPGLVVAALSDRTIILVEPRRKRAEFLIHAARALGVLDRTEVIIADVQKTIRTAAIISARAVASLDGVIAMALQCSNARTRWILPKGRNAREEVAAARLAWHGVFHVEQSITDPHSFLVLASGISRR